MSEHSIASARASVMLYDDSLKKWIPSGNTPGLAKVHIYRHAVQNTFRIVGRKIQDHEVVINCAILRGLKYKQATPTFHQWRDNRQVYGLNFSGKEDADSFASAVLSSIDLLNNNFAPRPAAPPPVPPAVPAQQVYTQPVMQQNNDDDNDSRTRQSSEPTRPTPTGPGAPPAPTPPPAPSAPPAPPAPPAPQTGFRPPASSTAPPAAPPPPAPPGPPPPPGGPLTSTDTSGVGGDLASALASAKPLKKVGKPDEKGLGGVVKGSGAIGGPGNEASLKPPVVSGGGANFLDEMHATLRRRLQKTDADEAIETPSPNDTVTTTESEVKIVSSSAKREKNGSSPVKVVPVSNSNNGESPRGVKKFMVGSGSSNDFLSTNGPNDSPNDLEQLKQEILEEMRHELHKMKLEIIEAMKKELSRI